jgi:hypothetical protein
MKVYVVIHANYGDQGVDYHKTFSLREKAENYIEKWIEDRGYSQSEKQWFSIIEETLD